MVVQLVGNVDPQTSAVRDALKELRVSYAHTSDRHRVLTDAMHLEPALIVVAGWRHIIPPAVLRIPRYGVVGFHSAKLPEYPGRAPVPWTLLRRDSHAWNTMLYLDEGVDSGDIIDAESLAIMPGDTPETLYEWIAQSDVRMLRRHLPALLTGTAPRMKQDPARRGPLTTADGWDRWRASLSS